MALDAPQLEVLRRWPWNEGGGGHGENHRDSEGMDREGEKEAGAGVGRRDIVVLAGVCLRSDGGPGSASCARVVGLLPGAAPDGCIKLWDTVLAVGVVPKCGGEVAMLDVRNKSVDAWPAPVLAAARERNASFRLLILRHVNGRGSVLQVDIAQVDLAKLKADCNDAACRAKTCADICALSENGDADLLRLLLNAVCGVGQSVDALFSSADETPLILASRSGRSNCVRCLLEYGADPARTSADSKAALYWSALEGHVECIEALHSAGADVNASDKHGFRALHGAALHGHSSCVQVLLEMGADIDAVLHDGKTAAYLAAMKGHVDCLRVLKKWDADLSRGDAIMGFCPVQAAVLNGHLDAVIFLSSAHRGVPPDTVAAVVSKETAGNGEPGARCPRTFHPSTRAEKSQAGAGERLEDDVDDEVAGSNGVHAESKDDAHTSESGRRNETREDVQGAQSAGAVGQGLREVGKQSACLFAAMIGKLDAARNTKNPGQHAHAHRREQFGVGLPERPQRVLVDIGIGYLATCYLASTVLAKDAQQEA